MISGIRKHLSNPAVGLLPYIIFIILYISGVTIGFAAIISIALAIAGEVSLRTYYKSRSFSPSFYISGMSLLITLFIGALTAQYVNETFIPIIVCEICVISLMMLLRASQTYIASTFFRKKTLFQKALINEYNNSILLIQYALTLHIFGVLLYSQFGEIQNEDIFDFIIIAILPIIIILAIGIFQILKINRLVSKLRKEEWLPIVKEKGEVTGKVAKSVSFNMKNKFLHPVVRVALVSNKKIYLQTRPANDILSPSKLDYPFEKYMLFNHQINLTARNSIRQMVGDELSDVSIKFLLKYVFENDDTKRLIFLFVAELEDEEMIKREGKMNGKFWTIKQIEDGFADEIFSESFELEFEYLKNMELVKSDICKSPISFS